MENFINLSLVFRFQLFFFFKIVLMFSDKDFKPFRYRRYFWIPFWEILNFHLEGKGCPDTYERRDYEALAR